MPKLKSEQKGDVLQFSFRIKRETYDGLKNYCDRTGVNLTHAISFAITQFITLKKLEESGSR
jgi:hypothetical protein